MLFDLSKARFDDPGALFPEGSCVRVLQAPPHRLNFLPVRSDFNLPAFGVAGAAGAHGAVAPVAAKTFDAHTVLASVAFVIKQVALGTGDGVVGRIVMEVLTRVRVVFGGRAFGWWHQHRQVFFGGGLQVAARSIPRVGQGHSGGRGHAQVLPGLLYHWHQLAVVGFLAVGVAGNDHAFLAIGHGLGVVGVAIGVADFHPPGFRFDRMIVRASVGLQLRQTAFDLFAQGLAPGQSGGQTVAGLI